MKNIFYYLLLSIVIVCASCDDEFLDTSSPSTLSSETVYNSTTMAEAAVMGVYSKMTNTYIYGQKLSVNWQGVSDIECNREFNTSTYNSTSRDEGAGNYYDDSYNSTTKWEALYQMAELATTAVDGIRNSDILESSASEMKPLLGEALTLRAMAYFELVRYWGDVPFKTESSNSDLSNVYMAKTDRDTIYKYLVEDLEEAVDYLPWLGEDTDYSTAERITKGYAKGLLAKIALFAGGWSLRDNGTFPSTTTEHHSTIPESGDYYVGRVANWKDYYEIAAEQCAEMIGSADNPHSLDPDYQDIWETVCGMGQNGSNENLFEVAFGLGNNGDIGSLMGYVVDSNSKYGTRGFGGTYVTSTAYYFYSFDPEDTRRDVTLTWLKWSSDNIEEVSTNPLSVTFAKWRIYWMSDAYLALHAEATSRVSTGVNWILMRYSDIYLMFAEAEYELNGEDEVDATAGISARQALEKVRERAFGSGSSKISDYDSDFFEAIVNERAWEFGGESIRRQDLIRWGLSYVKIETMKKTLCKMFDHKESVTIFDKSYSASDFPETVYYKYSDEDEDYIDQSSLNYYQELGASPGSDYESVSWFPANCAIPEDGEIESDDECVEWPVKTLLAATGLYSSYDYSSFLSNLTCGDEISSSLLQYEMGNGVCDYRHMFAIYYEDIYESDGYLSNSFGY